MDSQCINTALLQSFNYTAIILDFSGMIQVSKKFQQYLKDYSNHSMLFLQVESINGHLDKPK
jgi:hypothetical protein